MSPLLTLALRDFLAQELSTLTLVRQGPDGDAAGPPQVWIGDLPPKRREREAREIPCLVILPIQGHQEEGEGVAVVALLAVVYNPEEGDRAGGEGDLALLISAVTRALLPASQGVPLARRFVLEADHRGRLLPWEKQESQPRPFIQAVITSQWRYKNWE